MRAWKGRNEACVTCQQWLPLDAGREGGFCHSLCVSEDGILGFHLLTVGRGAKQSESGFGRRPFLARQPLSLCPRCRLSVRSLLPAGKQLPPGAVE